MEHLLISVAKLEEKKPTKQLKALFSRKDRAEGEAMRRSAFEEAEIGGWDDDNWVPNDNETESDEEFQFGPNKVGRPNPKNQLVNYLKDKNDVIECGDF